MQFELEVVEVILGNVTCAAKCRQISTEHRHG